MRRSRLSRSASYATRWAASASRGSTSRRSLGMAYFSPFPPSLSLLFPFKSYIHILYYKYTLISADCRKAHWYLSKRNEIMRPSGEK